MASKRWEARNRRARQLGYKNYYDYRTHGYGAEPPTAPRPSGERLARLRGHRGGADLRLTIQRKNVELVKVLPQQRDKKTGQYNQAVIRITMDDGSEQEYTLTGKQLSRENLLAIQDMLKRQGAMILDSPSLDLFGRFPQGPNAPQ